MQGYAVIAWPGTAPDARHAEETRATISWSAAAAFCLVYLLLGLTGHDPWKQDEAYIFGIVQSLLETGDWVVPTLTGVPFMEKPPLFYMVAAACARLTSPWLPLHDGARLASGLFTGPALACTGLTARVVWGAGTGRLAALAFCASIGLLQHAHMMLTDVALLAGFAVAMLGLTMARQAPFGPGLLLGTGAGMAFLAKGLLGPGVIAIAALVPPMAAVRGEHARCCAIISPPLPQPRPGSSSGPSPSTCVRPSSSASGSGTTTSGAF